MNEKILATIFLIFVFIISISTIQASDLNETDFSSKTKNHDLLQMEIEDLNDFNTTSTGDILQEQKNKTEFLSSTESIYYKGSYDITLKDTDANSTLANKQVTLRVNSINFTGTTDEKGILSINLNLTPGNYDVTAIFSGDDTYESTIFNSTVNILSTIKAADITKYYEASTPFAATFYDSMGNPLANRDVTIIINGKSYTKRTDGNGLVTSSVNFKPGTYKIVSIDPVTGYRLTTTFKILSTISADNLNVFVGSSKKFSAKFLKSNGKALAKTYVKFKLKGKTYKVKTNSKGIASISLKKLKKGSYKITCYNKDSLTKTCQIKVFKKKASTKLTTRIYTFYQNETKMIQLKFSTALGGSTNAGKVIKIKINGKTYSKKTDGSGLVNLKLPNLPTGVYTVKYSYAGSKYYKAASKTNYVSVIDSKTSELTVKGTRTFGYGAGTLFKVAFTAGGVPLIKKTVKFTIDGKSYTGTTDNKGIASIPINLKIGTYTVNYRTDDYSKVNGSNGSCEIEVIKRGVSKIVWKSESTFKDSSQTFKILLTDKNGKPVSGEMVQLKIDGVTYYAKTSSKGIATFKTYVALGKYKVSFKFEGNNLLLKSSASKTVKVKLSKFKNGVNEKNPKGYSSYLKSSSHCPVGSAKIKALVKSLTKGMKSKVDKAKAIFNYVRDNLAYRYYYNTRYGAKKTLKYKKGNCVDHSHLLVAMFRTAGLHARYVHGTCKFSSGNTYGHVWTQVLVDKHWVCADATSYDNSLGKIVNWNVKSYSLHNKYASLPF